jgi:hypothetical protein
VQGVTGATGSTGGIGAAGVTGATGVAGATGALGVAGATGAAGVAGATGATGVAGAAGATGVAGATGATGLAGGAGATGVAGVTGATGSRGIAGAAGVAGATGATGATGASPFTLNGSNAVFTAGSVGIGTTTPASTAVLDLTSTTQGLLPPRMTTTERLAIARPANGLMVYDTTTNSLQIYDSVGAAWNQVVDSAITSSVTNVSSASTAITVANPTTTPVITLGTVPVGNGGTGLTTFAGYLVGNGSSAIASATIPAATALSGVVPVANGGTGTAAPNGYLSGNGSGSITSSTTIPATTLSGIVPIANGGTGGTSVAAIEANVLPPQNEYSWYMLATNGTSTYWTPPKIGAIFSMMADPPLSVVNTPPSSVPDATKTSALSLGVVPMANGGTGQTSFPKGQALFGNGSTNVISSSSLCLDSMLVTELGIGTCSPVSTLDIETSSADNSSSAYGYVTPNDAGGTTNGEITSISLYTAGRIIAPEFYALSDARIKNVIDRSDSASDLDLLQKIKITDFRYIDVVGKGSQAKKGVIAQEVEKIYPDAVHQMKGFIPSVYAMADEAGYNDATHELKVKVPKAHAFVAGDVVRIITDAGKEEKPVAKVIDDHTFVLSGVEQSTSTPFVYGKQVNDLREVDYDQLFSLNISATQQLALDGEALTKATAALEEKSEAMEKRLAASEQAVEALEKQK